MRLSIMLYSTDPYPINAKNIENCVSQIDFSNSLEVSRSLGPATYFELNKKLHSDSNELINPVPLDILRKKFDTPFGINLLYKENSVLTIHYTYSKSQRIQILAQSIAKLCNGLFFSSDSRMQFGPSDIVDFAEDENAEDVLVLIDLSFFSFSLDTDNFTLDPQILRDGLDRVPEFADLRADLEKIVGPLKLFISC